MENYPRTVREAYRRIDSLIVERDNWIKINRERSREVGFQTKVAQYEELIRAAQNTYTVYLLESLDSESRKLTKLTMTLIFLTVILAVLALPSFVHLLHGG